MDFGKPAGKVVAVARAYWCHHVSPKSLKGCRFQLTLEEETVSWEWVGIQARSGSERMVVEAIAWLLKLSDRLRL
jgi:hypothetical protein